MKLYELSKEYQELQHLIEEGDIPEEAINDTLESINAELKVKADNIACIIKNLESEAEMIKNEANRQLTRADIKVQKANRMRKYLKDQLEYCQVLKIETPRNKIQIKPNPKKVIIFDEFFNWAQQNADSYLKYSAPQPDKAAIKEALKEGKMIPFVKLISEKRIEIK